MASDAIVTIALVLLTIGTTIGTLAAPWIIDAYSALAGVAQGAGHGAQQALATDLLRWFMPQMFFYGVTALATAMLNARRRFAAAAFAPVLNNVVVIAMLLAVVRIAGSTPTVHRSSTTRCWSCSSASARPPASSPWRSSSCRRSRRAGASFHWDWEPRHPAVRKLARLSGWTVGYVATNQVAFFVVLVLAYRTKADVSIYLAAFTFFQLPARLARGDVMTTLAPELAARHQAGDIDGLRDASAPGCACSSSR